MYTILHGDDEFSTSEHVGRIRQGMGDPQFAELNTVRLDGRKVTLNELKHTCSSMPFLAEKRLVLVDGLLTHLEPRHKKGDESSVSAEEPTEESQSRVELVQELKEYLAQIPTSTELVFIEAKSLAKNNPILKAADADKGRAQVFEYQPPKESSLPSWIATRAQKKGAQITPDAVRELAMHIGADLRLLDNELDKLAMYCGEKPIEIEDVQRLVASVHEANIFQLVDAIGARNTREAMRLLHEHLNQNAAPLYLLAMITRQFRMLVQVKDLTSRRLHWNAIASQLRMQSFVTEKVAKQAGNFTMLQLEMIYRKLLETDLAIKTGRSDPVVALDVLVMELMGR